MIMLNRQTQLPWKANHTSYPATHTENSESISKIPLLLSQQRQRSVRHCYTHAACLYTPAQGWSSPGKVERQPSETVILLAGKKKKKRNCWFFFLNVWLKVSLLIIKNIEIIYSKNRKKHTCMWNKMFLKYFKWFLNPECYSQTETELIKICISYLLQ